MTEIVKEYTNGEVVIEWRPDCCEHSSNCFRNLPAVFNPRVKPWIQPEHATSAELIAVVSKCPSGALRIQSPPLESAAELAFATKEVNQPTQSLGGATVQVVAGGPLRVNGPATISDPNGTTITIQGVAEFCRCGKSKTKPYCDKSHLQLPGWDT